MRDRYQDWYWRVGDGDAEVWSSATRGYVPIDNPQYLAWESAGNLRSTVSSTADLFEMLPELAPISAADVRKEAERRISTGMLIGGSLFRTDDGTMMRLRGLLDAFDAAVVPQGGVTYRTAAGNEIQFTDKPTVQSLYNAANLYRSAVLEASRILQTSLPTDYADDGHWPPV